MSKSTNVSVSMSPSCARAWRRLERSFTGDEAMLSVMVRGLADAWDESATAIDEASDALDLESRSVGPSSGRLNERRYGKQHISTNKTLQPVPPTETPLPNQIIFQRKQIGGCGRKVVLLQCLFDRFGSVFPQCGLMVFPGVVIVSR